MKLYLLGKERIETITLPEKIEESLSLSETFSLIEDYPLVIEGINNKWHLK